MDAGRADKADGLMPGSGDNAAGICFGPEKPRFPLSVDGTVSQNML